MCYITPLADVAVVVAAVGDLAAPHSAAGGDSRTAEVVHHPQLDAADHAAEDIADAARGCRHCCWGVPP